MPSCMNSLQWGRGEGLAGRVGERERGRGGGFSVHVAVVPFSPAPKHEEMTRTTRDLHASARRPRTIRMNTGG